MNILIVTNDGLLMRQLDALLTNTVSNNISATDSGEDAVSILTHENEPTLVIIGPTTSDLSGPATLRLIRDKKPDPIIVLQATNDIPIRCKMLLDGADDVLHSSVDRDELLARAQTVMRRFMGHANNIVTVGSITMDMTSRRVTVDGVAVHLTGLEMACLEVLMQRKGSTVTKQAFMDAFYGGRDEPEIKIVDVIICKVRAKLGAASKHVTTDWGRGYRIEDDPQISTKHDEPARWRCLKLLAEAPKGSYNTRTLIANLQPITFSTAQSLIGKMRGEGLIETFGLNPNIRHTLTPAGKAALEAYISATTPANAA